MSIFDDLARRAYKDRARLQQQEEARQADAENKQTIENKEMPAPLQADCGVRQQ